MKCPMCNTKNPEKAIYCGECAYRLPRLEQIECPNSDCKSSNPKGQKYCSECGVYLMPTKEIKCLKCKKSINTANETVCNECGEQLPPPDMIRCPECDIIILKGEKKCDNCNQSFERTRKESIDYYVMQILSYAFVAIVIIPFIILFPGTWNELLSVFFGIIGMYGLAIGFIANYGSSDSEFIRSTTRDMTSPNILRYTRGNVKFLMFITTLLATAFGKEKTVGYPMWQFPTRIFIAIAAIVLFFFYGIVHLIFVLTFSYIPIVISSIIVNEVIYAHKVEGIEITRNSEITELFYPNSIVKGNPTAIKGFLIGFPAITVSFITTISSPFIT